MIEHDFLNSFGDFLFSSTLDRRADDQREHGKNDEGPESHKSPILNVSGALGTFVRAEAFVIIPTCVAQARAVLKAQVGSARKRKVAVVFVRGIPRRRFHGRW